MCRGRGNVRTVRRCQNNHYYNLDSNTYIMFYVEATESNLVHSYSTTSQQQQSTPHVNRPSLTLSPLHSIVHLTGFLVVVAGLLVVVFRQQEKSQADSQLICSYMYKTKQQNSNDTTSSRTDCATTSSNKIRIPKKKSLFQRIYYSTNYPPSLTTTSLLEIVPINQPPHHGTD